MSKQDTDGIRNIVWVGGPDPKVAGNIATAIDKAYSAGIFNNALGDEHWLKIIHSKDDSKSMIESMREVDPNFFLKSVKATYQDLYFEQGKRINNALGYLEFAGAVSGDVYKQGVVDAAVRMLKTGQESHISVTNVHNVPIVTMTVINGELVDVKEK